MKCLVAVVGPTAVGKSRLGIAIAREFKGEIVNADSRQIYKFMDIGTAKPGREDREAVKHHMLDIIPPDQPYSLATFQEQAYKCVAGIQEAGGLPVLVGGSGQYVWALLEGWSIPAVEPDPVFREGLMRRAEPDGGAGLYRELEDIDCVSAAAISPRNLRRIIRALELYQKTGKIPSSLRSKRGLPYPVLVLGLTAGREHLYSLIDRRTDRMVESGFVEEVKNLLDMGYHRGLASMSSLGYGQIADHLAGRTGLQEAVQVIKYETHRYARNQYAWFRPSDGRIRWFETGDGLAEETSEVTRLFLSNAGQD
jgi:tRNA dimethylallyltransferase